MNGVACYLQGMNRTGILNPHIAYLIMLHDEQVYYDYTTLDCTLYAIV